MAAGTLYSASTYTAFVKNRFPQREIDSLVTFNKPFLNALKKVDDLEGNATYIPLETDHPQGLGSSLANISQSTIASITGSRGIRFALDAVTGYAMITIDGPTMMRMRSNDGSWFRAREREVKNALESVGQQLEMFLWQSGSGSIGTVSSDPGTGTTFTLVTAANAINFHEGMTIQFYADSSGNPSASARSGGPYLVTAVNYDTGVITVSAALDASILSTGSLDHIVRYGNSGYISGQVGVAGVPKWIPSSDPTDTLFGVARTNYPQKLGGHRQSWLGSIEETVKALDVKIRRVNQKPKTLWLSYANFNRLEQELGARGYRMEDGAEGKFGRPALMMSSPGGGVTVMAGPYVPETGAWLLDMGTWELHHLGGLPHIIEDDGNMALRVQSLANGSSAELIDAIEVRIRWMANLYCTNPFANGYAAIS